MNKKLLIYCILYGWIISIFASQNNIQSNNSSHIKNNDNKNTEDNEVHDINDNQNDNIYSQFNDINLPDLISTQQNPKLFIGSKKKINAYLAYQMPEDPEKITAGFQNKISSSKKNKAHENNNYSSLYNHENNYNNNNYYDSLLNDNPLYIDTQNSSYYQDYGDNSANDQELNDFLNMLGLSD